MKKSKSANIDGISVLLLFIVVVAAIGIGTNLDTIGSWFKSVPGSVGGDDGVNEVCQGGQTQSWDMDGVNKDTKTANTEAENAYRKIGDSAWTSFTLGTAITGQEVGADYEVVIGIDDASETANAYGRYFTVENLPCVYNPEIEVVDDETAAGLTATFYNADNNAAAETGLTAGTQKWVHLKWKAAKDEYFGNPFLDEIADLPDNGVHRKEYPNTLCMDLNNTMHEAPEVKFEGVSMARVSQPTQHAGGGSGHTTYCYEAPVIDDTEQIIDVLFEADGSNAIDMDDTSYLYAGGMFLHSETKELMWGSVTDDGNYVGAAAADTLTLDFT